MKFIIGKKIEMSQKFLEDGTVVPVTLVSAPPCVVTELKTVEDDGYNAVQIGSGKAKRVNKAQQKLAAEFGPLATLKEFRVEAHADLKTGDMINVSVFSVGDHVDVTGFSKGHGFQGVVKRHGFHGSPATHGHKDQERMPGSIGAGGVQRVMKGRRMAGHMGDEKVTVKNLEIVDVDAGKNILAIKGAIPGARGGKLLIRAREGKRIWQK